MARFNCGHCARGYNALKVKWRGVPGTRCRLCYNKLKREMARRKRNTHSASLDRSLACGEAPLDPDPDM
jgi:hypothetical protein